MKRAILRPSGPQKQSSARSSLYNCDLAISYGTVKKNNTNGTCVVTLITGFDVTERIPSEFPPGKKPSTGSIRYPRIGSYVAVLHPKGDLSSGFVVPAVFDIRDQDVISDLLSSGDKSISDDGWEISRDRETGALLVENGGFSLSVNPDSGDISLTDFHGNTLEMTSDRVTINSHFEILQ